MLDRAEDARQVVVEPVRDQPVDGGEVVDLGEDEVVGRGPQRRGDDTIARDHCGEVRGAVAEDVRLVAHVRADSEDQVVLGLAGLEEGAGDRQEPVDIGEPVEFERS